MKILFIGDIVGKPGRRAIERFLKEVRSEHDIDFIIANGENAAGGFGITETVAAELFEAGIDVITTGNHVWDKREAITYLPKENRIIRPLNFPADTPGVGSIIVKSRGGPAVGVINIEGRVFMRPVDCPFRAVEKEISDLADETEIVVVDFHAEATSEKLAMGWFLDGRVTAVVGTHTHVQTADERVLPGGTAYITDVGMTGPSESVIGVKKDIIVRRFLSSLPERFETAKGFPQLQAVVIESGDAGKAVSISRISLVDRPD
jgi:metallophosphoesterase (TIGR00282 family)